VVKTVKKYQIRIASCQPVCACLSGRERSFKTVIRHCYRMHQNWNAQQAGLAQRQETKVPTTLFCQIHRMHQEWNAQQAGLAQQREAARIALKEKRTKLADLQEQLKDQHKALKQVVKIDPMH